MITARVRALTAPLAIAAAAGAAWFTVAALGPEVAVPLPCPLLELTGMACPFCGGTRAAYALAHGDVATAAGHNAVVVSAVPVLVVLWFRWSVRRARGVRGPMVTMSAGALLALGAGLVVFAVVRNLPFGAALGP
ncbi:MAG TPA: DUF2752 domain-containing protein [Jiangellaceae bacterium]|nr:DUF2752 domain-containing protein [Jiangellaceae bacterium]